LSNIHIIGDSHCLLFDNVTPHWFDASTAYNLWKQNRAIEEVVSNIEGEVWFCFGWVDCQRHIYGLEQDTGISRRLLIEQTVTQYINYLSFLQKKYTYISVLSVPPAGFEDNIYNLTHFPDRDTIIEITNTFNSELQYYADFTGLGYIDIWHSYKELWPEEGFKEDKAHIKNEIATARLQRWLDDFNNSSML
jgi:hypothetical protein